MSNKTVSNASRIHGTDPQHLIEKIIRERIYDCVYWKEKCFGINMELVVDRAVQLDCIGGTYGANLKPTGFLCLILKMLQLAPDSAIVQEFIKCREFKYLQMLGLFYLRFTSTSKTVYESLEPFLSDYRKVRVRCGDDYIWSTIDEVVDDLLQKDRVFSLILPRITKRAVLENEGVLAERISPLQNELSLNEELQLPVHETPSSHASLSIEETNQLRLKLGLKPLKAN